MKNHLHHLRGVRRPAFSLVELVVVIAIILILASLGSWGVFSFLVSRQRSNTVLTINVVNKLLEERWAAVIADARKETPSPMVMSLAQGPQGNLDPTRERARVIWIKVRLMEAFPTSYSEVIDITQVNKTNKLPLTPPYPTPIALATLIPPNMRKPYFYSYQQAIANRINLQAAMPTTLGNSASESSACLLMSLKALSGGIAIEDRLKYAIEDTDNDGLPEFVDGWKIPMAFFRFPWNHPGLQQSNPTATSSKNADSIDNGGTLLNPNWYHSKAIYPLGSQTARQIYEANIHPIRFMPNPAPNPPPDTPGYYIRPVIASAGRDGKFGLAADPTATNRFLAEMSVDTTNGGFETDNIYSFQLRPD